MENEQKYVSIQDLLIGKSQNFTLKLWEENIVGKPLENVDGHIRVDAWYYVPYDIKEDLYHREHIEGTLKTYISRNDIWLRGLKLFVYDEEFIGNVKKILGGRELTHQTVKELPDYMLRVDKAKIYYHQFPCPMFHKGHPDTWLNGTKRLISSINLLGIVKEVIGDKVIFYDGWDPDVRGEQIRDRFFVEKS